MSEEKKILTETSDQMLSYTSNGNESEQTTQRKIVHRYGKKGTQDGDFIGPISIAHDPESNEIYVLELKGNRIQKFLFTETKIVFVQKFGSRGNGNFEFFNPRGLSIDPVSPHNLYVADTENSRIQVISRDGKFISTFNTNLINPTHVAFCKGAIYVADSKAEKIAIFDRTHKFTGWMGPPISDPRKKFLPYHMCVHNKELYVTELLNNRISIFSSNGTFSRSVGTYGPKDGQFILPMGVAHNDTELCVSDYTNHRIQFFSCSLPENPENEYSFKYSIVDEETTADKMFPSGVCATPSNSFIVCDHDNCCLLIIQ